MGNNLNLIVSDIEFLLEVKSTALLHYMLCTRKKYYLLYILLFSDNLIKEGNGYLTILKILFLNLEHLLDFFSGS